jgi:hypothetical protein
MKYKYTGEVNVSLTGIGSIEPGQVIETDVEINHPLFVKSESKDSEKIINKKPKGGKHE